MDPLDEIRARIEHDINEFVESRFNRLSAAAEAKGHAVRMIAETYGVDPAWVVITDIQRSSEGHITLAWHIEPELSDDDINRLLS